MKKKVTKKINTALSIVIIVILIPLLITIFFQQMQLKQLMGKNVIESAKGDTQLIGILAKEISVNHGDECIKAQAVIARTNLYAAWEDGTTEPEALTLAQMQELWGDNFPTAYEKLNRLITATAGETLTYEKKYIYAAYHAISAGNTRNMAELYPETKMPYLASVACHEDTQASQYLAVNYWEKEEFLELCKQEFPEAQITDVTEAAVLSRDSAGYVTEIQIGQTVCDGETFRKHFGLNSSNFSMTYLEGNVRIVTLGLGHGFGLSQYTAEKMAQAGKDYIAILEYFYPGAKITE